MRSYLRVFLFGIFLLGMGYLGLCAYAKDNPGQNAQTFNRYNILVRREAKYVKIDNKKATDNDGFGNYDYTLTSYDQSGNKKKINFTGMKKLKQGRYLKLDTKGNYVYSYKEVFKKDIPSDVFTKLNLQ